jgi:hypothetical protein
MAGKQKSEAQGLKQRRSGRKIMPSKKASEKETDTQKVLERLSLVENKLEILDSHNSELQNLLRILAHPILSNSLQGIFKTSRQLYAYELSNGERSTRDIGRLVNSDQKTISNWWREWESKGLVEKAGKRGQFRARYSLLELLVIYSPGNDNKSLKELKDE